MTNTDSSTVTAYRVLATGQVVCTQCASDNLGPDGQATGYIAWRRMASPFYCVGCDAADLPPYHLADGRVVNVLTTLPR